ncbi:GNAT family N-acetyltransferase [Luteimicrobium subarcticum]|uniref:GNAT family N-acetyltransferase n=1 Tax=Luteimicrobium subarcticum TaxID=620910 RepID=UPI0012FD7A61|nr:GNAT family N-acetyltransferase [Luteimicrobium subarcticum]
MDLEGRAPQHVRSERVRLDAVTADDVDDLVAIGRSLEHVWWTFPPVDLPDRSAAAALVDAVVAAWARDGLGYWTVRDPGSRVVLGFGGCSQLRAPTWNLYYRARPSAQGRGLAAEVLQVACDWARAVDPDVPVTAVIRAQNVRAADDVQQVGLSLVHQDDDGGDQARRVYADRDLPAATLAGLLGAFPAS